MSAPIDNKTTQTGADEVQHIEVNHNSLEMSNEKPTLILKSEQDNLSQWQTAWKFRKVEGDH